MEPFEHLGVKTQSVSSVVNFREKFPPHLIWPRLSDPRLSLCVYIGISPAPVLYLLFCEEETF